jgi:hypothetical protein
MAVVATGRTRPKIQYTYDPESKGSSFRVPSLGIVGGAETQEEAERLADEAIAFAGRNDQPATGR